MTIAQLWQETDRMAEELFGNGDGSNLSNVELDVIFSDMSHREKVEALRVEKKLVKMWAGYKAN